MTRCAPRKRLLFSLAAFTLLLCAPARAQPHHKRAVREQIEALERQWRSAQLAGDISAMDNLLSDDYLGITGGGQVVTKAQQLDRMRSRSLVMTQMKMSDLKVKLIGHIAVVTSLAELVGTSEGKPLLGSFRYTRIYQRLPNGTWKITNFEATRVPGGHPDISARN